MKVSTLVVARLRVHNKLAVRFSLSDLHVGRDLTPPLRLSGRNSRILPFDKI